MEFRLMKPIDFNPSPITPAIPAPKGPEPAQGKPEAPSFSNMLHDAIREVDVLQDEANRQIEGVILKKDGVTTHDAMLALEKADIAFQLMNTIRGKIVRAYEDIIRTQV